MACKHEGVKPYSCPLCAVLFSSLKGQRRHLGKFHPGAPKGGGSAAGASFEEKIQAGHQMGEQIGNGSGGQLGEQIGGQIESQAMVQLGTQIEGDI